MHEVQHCWIGNGNSSAYKGDVQFLFYLAGSALLRSPLELVLCIMTSFTTVIGRKVENRKNLWSFNVNCL